MIRTTLSLTIASAIAFNAGVATSATPEEQARPQPLAQARNYITFPNYTPEQKQTVVEQAEIVLETYVNRESKLLFYGDKVDPLPRIRNLLDVATFLPDADLHLEIGDIFESQRDLHLAYSYPAPYQCFVSLQLFNLTEVYSPTNIRKAVVSNIINAAFLSPNISQLSLGDEVVSIDGVNLEEAISQQIVEGAGANTFGGFYRALDKLTFRSHRSDRVPVNNSVNYTFKRATDGRHYEVNLPWIATANPACISSANLSISPLNSNSAQTTEQALAAPSIMANERARQRQLVEASLAEYQVTANTIAPIPADPRENSILWDVIETRSGQYGYLRISSMLPRVGIFEAYNIVGNLLMNELKDTKGLIIDVRGNAGGFVSYAEALIQMFTHQNVEAYGFRPLRSNLNDFIFTNFDYGPEATANYADLLNGNNTGLYAKPWKLTDEFLTNRLSGQLYFKPVAVLTDAACYSACDLFTGLMQDFSDAEIWGSDLVTGAGGATVIDHGRTLVGLGLDQVPETGIQPLPGGQRMSLAWLQAVRTGKNANRLIEDRGILADRRARPTISDIQGKTQSQLDRIINSLRYQASDYRSAVSIDANSAFVANFSVLLVDVANTSTITLPITVSDTDRVEVFIGNEKVGSYSTWGGKKQLEIEFPNLGAFTPIELRGIKYGDVAWRTVRYLNFVD